MRQSYLLVSGLNPVIIESESSPIIFFWHFFVKITLTNLNSREYHGF